MADGNRNTNFTYAVGRGRSTDGSPPDDMDVEECNNNNTNRALHVCSTATLMGRPLDTTHHLCDGWITLLLAAMREALAAYFFAVIAMTVTADWGICLSSAVIGFAYWVSSTLFGGALINPIMSVAVFLSRKCTFKALLLNVIFQFAIGYVLAAVTVKYGLGIDISSAVPMIPSHSIAIGFVSEFIGVFLCCTCSCAASFKEGWSDRAFLTGLMLATAGVALSKRSGACFNPWFALSVSLFSFFDSLSWIYYVAPIPGVFAAALVVYVLGLQTICKSMVCPIKVSSCGCERPTQSRRSPFECASLKFNVYE